MNILNRTKTTLTALTLLTFSPLAMAFPLTSISLSNSIFMLLPLLFATNKNAKSKKAQFGFYLTIASLLAGLTYHSSLLSSIQLAASEHEYQNYNSANLSGLTELRLSDPQALITAMRLDDSFVAHLTRSPEPIPTSSEIYGVNDEERFLGDFASRDYSRVVLTSEHSQTAQLFSRLIEVQSDTPVIYNSIEYQDHATWIQKNVGPLDVQTKIHYPDNTHLRHADQIKAINYITIGTDKLLGNDYYGNGPVIPKSRITSLSSKEWGVIKSKIDPSKNTVIFYPDRYDENSTEPLFITAKYIASMLDLTSIEITTKRLYADNEKEYDNTHTSWMPNENKIISPPEFYHFYQKYAGKVGVICFSESCENIFPFGSTINVYEQNMIAFNHGFSFNLASIRHLIDRPVVLAPHDAQSLNVAYHLSEVLYKNGYDYRGLTQNPSLYFGASQVIGESVYPDDIIIQTQVDIENIYDYLSPDKPLITNYALFSILSLLLGSILALARSNVIVSMTGNAIILYVFVNINSLILLPEEYYMSQTLEPLYAALIFSVFGWLQFKNLFVPIINACVVLFFWSKIPPVADAFTLFVFTPQFLALTISFFNKQKKESPMIGNKAEMTRPFIRGNLKGKIINPNEASAHQYCKPGVEYILRSNHLSESEQSLAGIHNSYPVNRSTIDSVLSSAIKDCQKDLSDSEIQFWLQPFIACEKFGVIASHHDHSLLTASYSIGDGEDVTSGASSSYNALQRLGSNNKLEKKLLKVLCEIESHYNSSVIVEFGLSKKNKVTILQVRPYIFHVKQDSKTGKYWVRTINSKLSKKLIKVNYPVPTLFGQSVLSELFEWRVFSDSQSIYALKGSKGSCGRPLPLILESLILIHANIDMYRSTSAIMKDIKAQLALIADSYLSLNPTERASSYLSSISEMTRDYSNSQSLVLENDFDCGSQFLSTKASQTELPDNIESARDAYHNLFALGIAIIAKHAKGIEKEDFSGVSLVAFEKGFTGKQNNIDITLAEFDVVVDGVFAKEQVTIKEFMISSNKRELHVLADTIPSAFIAESMQAASITLKYGSRLSHCALSAKACNTPLRIARTN